MSKENESALLAQMAHTWDAFWTRTGGFGSTTQAWEEVLAEVRKFDEENKPTVPLEKIKMWVGDIAGCVRQDRWQVAVKRLTSILKDLGIEVALPKSVQASDREPIAINWVVCGFYGCDKLKNEKAILCPDCWQDAKDDPDSIK